MTNPPCVKGIITNEIGRGRGWRSTGGDLLEGFLVDQARDFQDCLDAERADLRDAAQAGAWEAGGGSADAGPCGGGGFLGKGHAGRSTFNEQNIRRLLILLDQVGDRVGALRAYAGLAERFEAEFDALPSPETQWLVERIRTRTASGDAPSATQEMGGRRSYVERRARTLHNGGPRSAPGGRERRTPEDRRAAPKRRTHPDRRRSRGTIQP